MSPSRAFSAEQFLDPQSYSNRERSTSTASRASSSRSSISRESSEALDRSSGSSVPQSPKPSHKKSGSFSRLFGTKEPSLDSFKHLAELQQKELAQKGQKLPFGVPQAKLPSTVKDDYKKAKQRAKERAKVHEAVKEKMKQHEDQDTRTHHRMSFPPSLSLESKSRHSSTSSLGQIPKSPKSPSKRFSALDPLPEVPNVDNAVESPKPRARPVSMFASYGQKRASVQITGLLTGDARKEALPWE